VQAVACIACFIITLIPKFDTAKYQKFRGIMYIILGLSCGGIFAILPFLSPYTTPTNGWIYAIGGYIYIQGAIIYMIKCPERCHPGKFDFCGASHQIFHFFVLAAALLHYVENYKMFRARQAMQCPIWEH
jgi:adiponectin receptor